MKNHILTKSRLMLEKWPFAFFCMAAIIQYREILFFNKKIGWDTLDAIFPHFLFMVDAFKNLKLPYYNPLIQGGFSFGENFFTAFLLNPLDIGLALISTVFSPLSVFQLQFPVFAALSGYWFFKFLYKINNKKFYSLMGGLCYFSAMLFPVAGQIPFFYAFFLLAFLVCPFNDLVSNKINLSNAVALVVLITLMLKTYYFFIPFFLILGFITNIYFYKNSFMKILFYFALASIFYALITFPILSYLKISLQDLHGTFLSPEPRLRSLVPEQIYYNSSIINVIGDIVDNRIMRGGAWTRGFNIGLILLFFIQMVVLFTSKVKKSEKSLLLFLMDFTMFIARGSLNTLHNAIPLIKSFRWAFSYVYFSQIFYLLIIFLYPLKINEFSKKQKYLIAFSFLLFFGWIAIVAENLKYLVLLLPVFWLVYTFLKKENWFFPSVMVLCLAHLYKPIDFNRIQDNGERKEISNRVLPIELLQNVRGIGKPGDYLWEDRNWLYKKEASMNGYNNSIHPIFWYLKGASESSQIAISLCLKKEFKIKTRSEYSINDNTYLEEYRTDLLNLIKDNKCSPEIENFKFTMENLKFQAVTRNTLILQNMNAFKLANSEGIKEESLPGGIRLITASGNVNINYEFDKSIWTKIVAFNTFFLLTLLAYVLQISFNCLRKRI